MPLSAASSLDYVLLDVFTDRAFAGNPLAVFPAAPHLDAATMQRIARELNLSETVFVGPARDANRFPVRIFTPKRELAFAGHPTVGTALLLKARGMVDATGTLVLEEGVGDVAVVFEDEQARFTTAQPLHVEPSPLRCEDAARLLGLQVDDIVTAPVVASCGTAFELIELASLEALAAITLDMAHLNTLYAGREEVDPYCFVRLDDGRIRSRMFGPLAGIPEDPATGSAAAPLAGYLAGQQAQQECRTYTIEQGVEMGRPSLIHASVDWAHDGMQRIHIAGQAVIIGEGRLLVAG